MTPKDLTFAFFLCSPLHPRDKLLHRQASEVPGGFAVSTSVAYEIATTATFTGSVTLAFRVPGPISEADFNSLAIQHNENGTLVDVTASTPARDYANLAIYATQLLSVPFYLARRGPHSATRQRSAALEEVTSSISVRRDLVQDNTS